MGGPAKMTPQSRRRLAKMKAVSLAKKSEARNKLLTGQLDGWFLQFDSNGDQQFNRDELSALLAHLNPGAPPTSEVIDLVMRFATGVYGMRLDGTSPAAGRLSGVYDVKGRRAILHGDVNGLVHRDQLIPVVKRYSAYIKEQVRLSRGRAVARAHAAQSHGRAGTGWWACTGAHSARCPQRGVPTPLRPLPTSSLTRLVPHRRGST